MSDDKTPTPLPIVGGYQERVAAAHHALFHDDPTDIAERIARHQEESNELSQALGMTKEEAHALVDYTWSRPAGEPTKEAGACQLTLASLCVIAEIDLSAAGEADLEKLQRPETIERIRAKRATRHGRGPLPGIDPAKPATVRDVGHKMLLINEYDQRQVIEALGLDEPEDDDILDWQAALRAVRRASELGMLANLDNALSAKLEGK